MKTTGFFNKETFRFGMLRQLFKHPEPAEKSNSIEDLQGEISTNEYRQKVEYLVKQDLLLRYSEGTVENGLKNIQIQITAVDSPQMQVVQEEEIEVTDKELVQIAKKSSRAEKEHEILTDEKKQEVWKVQNRIPKWFKNPHQINSRILIAFMDLLEDNKSVPLYKLEAACKSIRTFQSNYNQMKIFGERNHAKVFEEAGGRVTLWEPVREFVKKEFKQFKKRNNYY